VDRRGRCNQPLLSSGQEALHGPKRLRRAGSGLFHSRFPLTPTRLCVCVCVSPRLEPAIDHVLVSVVSSLHGSVHVIRNDLLAFKKKTDVYLTRPCALFQLYFLSD
jgi:hypothetical protein